MCQAYVMSKYFYVEFIGYRHYSQAGLYLCDECVEPNIIEEEYFCYYEKSLSLWTIADYKARYNYCEKCLKSLYKLKQESNEQWNRQLSSPTSIKQQRRFNKRRRQYGLQDGGTSTPRKQSKLHF